MGKRRNSDRKRVLVVGDLMLDRSWITSFRISATSQTHRGIAPQRRLNPENIDFRGGGAGMTALALLQLGDVDVHLLSADCGPHEKEIFNLVGFRRAELSATEKHSDEAHTDNTVTWHTLNWDSPTEPVTTIKFRIYDHMAGSMPTLRCRFDQDPPAGVSISTTLPTSLENGYDAVIIADFNKGCVTPNLLTALHKTYSNTHWYLDVKQMGLINHLSAIARETPFTVFVNRDEAERLYERLCRPDAGWGGIRGKFGIIRNRLLALGDACLRAKSENRWSLIVRLDQDGAVAFYTQDGKRMLYIAQAEPIADADGIGAGDFFNAGFVHAALRSSNQPNMVEAMKCGVKTAYRWVDLCCNEFWLPQGDGMQKANRRDIPWPSDIMPDDSGDVEPNRKPIELMKAIAKFKKLESYPNILMNHDYDKDTSDRDKKILNMDLARGYLGEFLTVDPARGRMLRHFAATVKDYFERETSRPLNCLVWADPGAGKSFFVQQAAKYAGAQFAEINISQMTSLEELSNHLAFIAGQKYSRLLLLIDEVDSKVNGSHVYPQLLAPLWDGTVMTSRGQINLGRHFATVLVASDENFRSAQEFFNDLRRNKQDCKGPDLADRIHPGGIFTLSKPEPADRAFMAVGIIQRMFQKVSEVHLGLLNYIVDDEKLGPRKIEQLIGALRPPQDGRITKADWEHLVSVDRAGTSHFGQDRSADKIKEYLDIDEYVIVKG